MSATETLARFAAGVRYEDLPREVVRKATLVLLDMVGNAFGGNALAEVRPIVAHVRSAGCAPLATVIGQDFKTGPADAAFLTGTVADALEHQDGYRFGGFHPSHTLPALLALGECRGVPGRELICGIVAAYEVANRVGAAIHPQATLNGWFPMAAAFGAAAGSARVLGLDGAAAAHAIGVAPYFTPLVFLDQIFGGSTVKPVFAGQLARAGVESALLAEAGITGWTEVLEAPRGFAHLIAGEPDLNALADGLGSRWTILDVHHKYYAACRHTHGAAQACQELAIEHELDPDQVEEVVVRTYEVAMSLVNRYTDRESSGALCTLSLPYVAAAALTDRAVGADQYRSVRIRDPRLQDLAGRVRMVRDPDLDALYPEYTATAVWIRLQDGATYERRVDVPLGDVRAPFPDTILLDKFRDYVGPHLGRERAERAAELLLRLETVRNVNDVIASLAHPTTHSA